MYIRQISRKNKEGSTVEYIQLAHNEWDPQKGHCRAKVLYSFGRKEHVDVEQLKRLVKSFSRFLPVSAVAESHMQAENRGRNMRWIQSRFYGGIHVLLELWKQLGFDQRIQIRIEDRNFSTPVALAVFALVAGRAPAPSGRPGLSDRVEHDLDIPDLPAVGVQTLDRAMDFLLGHQADL